MADETQESSSSSAKKSSAKKSTTGKSAAKKSTVKKSSTKKSPSKSSTGKRARPPRAEPGRRASGGRIAAEASRQLAELTGKEVEGVTGLHRSDDGWQVEVEVLELRRVPGTTDVLATYEVDVDESGDLQGYRRSHRYVRGQTEGTS